MQAGRLRLSCPAPPRPAPSPLPSSPPRSPFADPDHQAIGHAFSPDGFDWRQSPGAAATSVVAYEDGAAPGGVLNVTFGKRERPHLLFDPKSGAPVAFISAVAINPACDPFVFASASAGAGQARLPSIDAARLARISADPLCGAWVQYPPRPEPEPRLLRPLLDARAEAAHRCTCAGARALSRRRHAFIT